MVCNKFMEESQANVSRWSGNGATDREWMARTLMIPDDCSCRCLEIEADHDVEKVIENRRESDGNCMFVIYLYMHFAWLG